MSEDEAMPDSEQVREKFLQVMTVIERLPREKQLDFIENLIKSVFPEECTRDLDRSAYGQYLLDMQELARKLMMKERPIVADIFASGEPIVASCLPFQAVISSIHNATSGATKWQRPRGQAPYFLYAKGKGNTVVEFRGGDTEAIFDDKATASLWEQVRGFTDLDNDVILSIIAHLSNCSEEDGSAWFFADNFLDYRGVKPIIKRDTPDGRKRRAGHRQEDIAQVGASMGRIGNIWLTISQTIEEEATNAKSKRRKRKEYTHKGRLLSIDETWSQRELDTSTPDRGMVIGWKIRAGGWLRTFLESPNRQVAYLCQKTLEYDPYRQMWEKRLSRYFMFHGRMNTRARGGAIFNREIGPLLTELSLPIEEDRPQRTRDRFEKAITTLVEDGQIDGWKYKEEIQLPARNWLPTWLGQMITITIAPVKQLSGEAR